MQLRSVRVLFFCALFAISCAHNDPSAAQPVLRDGQGCGWDYPCPPDPGFGRPPSTRGSQVIIHNNYGSVNVSPGGAPNPGRHEGADIAMLGTGPVFVRVGGLSGVTIFGSD